MDYERFKEGFQDALKAELAVRGADDDHPSFICYVEAVNEVYNKVRGGAPQNSNGWTSLAQLRYHLIN